jgi:hypothetical protein
MSALKIVANSIGPTASVAGAIVLPPPDSSFFLSGPP